VQFRILSHFLVGVTLICGAATAQTPKKTATPQPAGPQPIYRANFIGTMDVQFRKVDADKNGQLTRAEIEQFEKQRAVALAEGRNRALFAQLDTDKNGQVSAVEFAKLIATPPPADATPMLQQDDANKDQQISLIEYRTATLANFDRIDTNKDGTVTPEEMKAGGITPR